MAKPGSWRFTRLAFYLRRPWRMALVILILLCTSLLLWEQGSFMIHGDEVDSGLDTNEDFEIGLRFPVLRRTRKDESHGKVSLGALDNVTLERRAQVKAAMVHAWSSYVKYAWGSDELQPQSRNGANDFGGLGATIIDSLDTLYIMDLKDDFKKARDWVAELDFNKNYDASMFETTIRVVGGLISAYDLSDDPMFLQKATEIADRLLPAWNTDTGIPYTTVNLAHGYARNPSWTGGSSPLADLATEQVEFIALSQRTGNPKYQEKVENVIQQLKKIFPQDGLIPIYVNPHTLHATNKISFGAMGDSFYEYLLKVWMLGNKTEVVRHYRDMWEQSIDGMMSLIRKTTPSSFTYIAERYGNDGYIDKMDELACFAPGMLALGASEVPSPKSSKYLNVAKELARTCYNFYRSTPTKLAGENYNFPPGKDIVVGVGWNILRPETVESLMYLWRKTGDSKYRDWGWDIFQAFEAQSRVESGYVGLRDVRTGEKDNKMQSFFLAETLKYLYLLFSPNDVIPLDQWVFNTEAHPIKVITRESSSEKKTTTSKLHRKQRLGRLNDE